VISVVKLSIEISEGIWVLDYKCKTLNVKFFFSSSLKNSAGGWDIHLKIKNKN
jgi:hypothetical protein